MAEKLIIIDGVTVGRGTGVKIEDNTNVSSEDTFDGPVLSGMAKTSYSVEISKIIAPDVESYMELRDILKSMKTDKKEVTIKETVRGNDGTTYTISQIFLRCLVESYSKELNVDSLTSETVKFSAEDLDESAERN